LNSRVYEDLLPLLSDTGLSGELHRPSAAPTSKLIAFGDAGTMAMQLTAQPRIAEERQEILIHARVQSGQYLRNPLTSSGVPAFANCNSQGASASA